MIAFMMCLKRIVIALLDLFTPDGIMRIKDYPDERRPDCHENWKGMMMPGDTVCIGCVLLCTATLIK